MRQFNLEKEKNQRRQIILRFNEAEDFWNRLANRNNQNEGEIKSIDQSNRKNQNGEEARIIENMRFFNLQKEKEIEKKIEDVFRKQKELEDKLNLEIDSNSNQIVAVQNRQMVPYQSNQSNHNAEETTRIIDNFVPEKQFVSTECLRLSFNCLLGSIWCVAAFLPEFYGSESCVFLRKSALILGCGLLCFTFIQIINMYAQLMTWNVQGIQNHNFVLKILVTIYNILLTLILLFGLNYYKDEECGTLPILIWLHIMAIILFMLVDCCIGGLKR